MTRTTTYNQYYRLPSVYFDDEVLALEPVGLYQFRDWPWLDANTLTDDSGNSHHLGIQGSNDELSVMVPPFRKYTENVGHLFLDSSARYFEDLSNHFTTLKTSGAVTLLFSHQWNQEEPDFCHLLGWRSSGLDTGMAMVSEYTTGYGIEFKTKGNDSSAMIQTLSVFDDDKPHIIAIKFDAGDVAVFVDGIQLIDTSITGTTLYNVSANFQIGGVTTGAYNSKYATDHISVFDKALTDAQIVYLSSLYMSELHEILKQ